MDILFDGHPSIVAVVSERSDGSMVWWNRLPVDEAIRQNRDRYFESIGINPLRVIAGGIAHGTRVAAVGDAEAGGYLLDTDALVTNVPNLFLSITVADCMPVFFYDPSKGAIGIAHAGWKGLVGGILENAVDELRRVYGSRPEDLLIAIGPHIGPCHYNVGEHVAEQFDAKNIERRDDKISVDLSGEAEGRLRRSEVGKVSVDPTCTYCESGRLYSARFDKTDPLQGAVAFIGIRPS